MKVLELLQNLKNELVRFSEEIAELMNKFNRNFDKEGTVDFDRFILCSPKSGLFRYNHPDLYRIVTAHEARHSLQIKNILKKLNFSS